MGQGGGSRYDLDMADIHALFSQGIQQHRSEPVVSHCPGIGGYSSHPADVHRHVDGIPAGEGLPGGIVIVDAVVTDTGDLLHNKSSFACSKAVRAAPEGSLI